MRVNKDECSCSKCSQAALLEKLFFYGWSELGPGIRKTIFKLLSLYVQTDVCDAAPREEREDMAFHLRVIGEVSEVLEKYELETSKN